MRLALAAASFCLGGCHRHEKSADPAPPEAPALSAIESTNAPTLRSPAPPLTPQATIEQVQKAFAQSPEEPRLRIEEAIATLKAGHTREGIGRLKMVDAEFDLDAEQQESIKNLIRAVR